ncbi:MAG: hypothetical protein M3Y33_14700 [Actinomycetota bacterium]|nr:hypothetical protein [Actinomycetota bacterium]
MGRQQDDEQAAESVLAQHAARRSHDLLELRLVDVRGARAAGRRRRRVRRPRALKAKIAASPAVVGTVLSLSASDEPTLTV